MAAESYGADVKTARRRQWKRHLTLAAFFNGLAKLSAVFLPAFRPPSEISSPAWAKAQGSMDFSIGPRPYSGSHFFCQPLRASKAAVLSDRLFVELLE
jgi:hypothetical protein